MIKRFPPPGAFARRAQVGKRVATSKKDPWLTTVWFLAVLFLVCGIIFSQRVNFLKKSNRQATEKLNKELAGFNEQSLGRLKKQVQELKFRVKSYADIFDPRQRWIKKDYDLTIYFVEELGKANQTLIEKAKAKGSSVPVLEFQDKLPSEQEATLLLNQLNGLREIVSLGLDYGANFRSITPGPTEENKTLPEIKELKSVIDLSCPTQFVMEFIVGLQGLIPRPCLDTLLFKSQGDTFDAVFNLRHVTVTPLKLAEMEAQEFGRLSLSLPTDAEKGKFVRSLRNKSPFFAYQPPPPKADTSEQTTTPPAEQPKAAAAERFIYHGTAVLRGDNVAVIEDTMLKETLFLRIGDKVEAFLLKNFSEEEAVLKNIQDQQETTIRRQEAQETAQQEEKNETN